MTDHELATKLKELAETAAPPPRIDLDRARRIGGRRRRVRTTALVLGCAAVVTAGGVTAVSVFRPVPPLAMAPAATAPASASGDLLVAKASFGWLPEQTGNVEYAVGAHGDTTVAVGRGEQPPMIVLSVFDQEPPTPPDLGEHPSRSSIRVGGRDGYWLAGEVNRQERSYLHWPAPGGRWAQLTEYGLDVPDLQQVLTRVAGDVTFADRGIPLPLRITSLPGSFHLDDSYLRRRPDEDGVPWRLMLAYSSGGASATIHVSPPGDNRAATGRPECVTKNGLQACVTFFSSKTGDGTAKEIGGITAKELLSRITVLGPDETKWTTRVIG